MTQYAALLHFNIWLYYSTAGKWVGPLRVEQFMSKIAPDNVPDAKRLKIKFETIASTTGAEAEFVS